MEKRYLDMGSVGMHPKGAYDKSVTYSKLQLVTYRNNTYLSKQDGNIGHEPVGEDEWWSLIVDAQTAYDGATSATAAAKRANDAADNAERINAEVQQAEDVRIASEQERATAETARDNAEQARQGDENLRKTAEENRASAETDRSDAEQRRDANETSRESAEQMRKSDEADRIRDEKEREDAETSRKAAENLRDTAENDRNDAEQERRQHEDARADAEGKRDTAETLRKQAETGRNNAEQERTTAEQTRKDSEASRVAAEQERTASEQTRQENETARVTAETERGNKETERIASETERKSAEQERKTAETGREDAEAGRVLAETARATAEAKREQAAEDNKAANDAAVAAAQAATEAADTATGKANTAAANADTATAKANAAAADAEKVNAVLGDDNVLKVTDRTGAEKSLELVSQAAATEMANKVEQNTADIAGVQKRLDMFGDAYVGFARVSGDADPKPSQTYIYGTRQLVREIGKHMKIGTVKRVGNEAVLQHEGAPGRITKASNGEAMAVDGSEGDLLVYTDIPLHLIKANEIVETQEMSCMGIGVVPCYWMGHAAKRLEPFAFAPFYTVNAKIFDDERSCSHCIISDAVAGTSHTLNGFVKESFRPNANGYYHTGISSLTSIHNAQNKNADPNTNRPYMGGYYEFYELWMMMMYIECGTLDTTDLYSMGVGLTQASPATVDTWNNERIAANSGIKMMTADGTVAGYAGLMSKSMRNGASGNDDYNLAAVIGSGYYSATKCGETLMVLDGITKAGLQAKVGTNTNVFYFDESNNLVCSTDINLDTGEGMTPNKRYFVVRDVPNCQGIGEGVLTAVVNTYAKFSVADGIYTGSTDLTGGTVIYKFSHSVYRGMSIPMDGAFMQLSGAHYVSGRTAEGTVYGKFYCADKVQDMAPLKSDTAYGDIGTEFNILKGLNNVKNVSGNSGWVSKADYSLSLFCFTEHSGGMHTKECRYTWNNNYIWGYGDSTTGLPATGKEGVKALVAGCIAVDVVASSCSANCVYGVGSGVGSCAGALAVPQLILSSNTAV